MKKIALLLLLVSFTFSVAQEKYKYLIVPYKFNFFKEDNKYNTSFIIKSFFEKEGFQVFYNTDNFPDELAKNRCLALFADATESNTMFSTKINIEIKDCYNKVIYTSDQGATREKQLEKAYPIAFRSALNSLKGVMNFKYAIEKSSDITDKIVEEKPILKANSIINTSELRAIPTESGYTLVNYSDNVVMVLYSTSLDTVFLAGKEIYKGVLLKKNSGWFFEYDFDGIVYSEKVEVKF
jgi:hypothetical protein